MLCGSGSVGSKSFGRGCKTLFVPEEAANQFAVELEGFWREVLDTHFWEITQHLPHVARESPSLTHIGVYKKRYR